MARSAWLLLVINVMLIDASASRIKRKSARAAPLGTPILEEVISKQPLAGISQNETIYKWKNDHALACGDLAYNHDGSCKHHVGLSRLAMHTLMAFISLLAVGGFIIYLHVVRSPNSDVFAAASPQLIAASKALALGAFYIIVSAVMIESNKWLMEKDHFPFPVTLTTFHMLMSFVWASTLRSVRPQFFPALQSIEVTPRFCMKFLPIGVPFAVSLICGNWAYRYLSVSFLQVMKQSNIVTVYIFSVIAGLEALRRSSVVLLAGVLFGALMAVEGEMHFVLVGFLLQVSSSLCEATKTLIQSVLMTGETKLDPLTMVLFMAPCCFLANLIPLVALEGHQIPAMMTQIGHLWPFLLFNTCLAFILNATVAQCIKQLSAVGFLLCGIVKDICIIATSAWFLGESLSLIQQVGFAIALFNVALYSLYKQNQPLFHDDNVLEGFRRLFGKCAGKKVEESSLGHEEQGEQTVMGNWQAGIGNQAKSYVRA